MQLPRLDAVRARENAFVEALGEREPPFVSGEIALDPARLLDRVDLEAERNGDPFGRPPSASDTEQPGVGTKALRRFPEHERPEIGLEHRLVDEADQIREVIVDAHRGKSCGSTISTPHRPRVRERNAKAAMQRRPSEPTRLGSVA